MDERISSLIEQIKELETELSREVQRKEVEFLYQVRKRKIRFAEEARSRHRKLAKRLYRTVLDSRFLVMFSAPVIWSCLVPLLILDLFVSVYQWICFPIYGIPRVRRREYVIAMDRNRLGYLNLIERINCVYCGYANGVLAYMVEIAARTEQYWCPIKHALRMKSIHSRYRHFLPYGDGEEYRKQIEEIRRAFEDLEAGKGESEEREVESPPPGVS